MFLGEVSRLGAEGPEHGLGGLAELRLELFFASGSLGAVLGRDDFTEVFQSKQDAVVELEFGCAQYLG